MNLKNPRILISRPDRIGDVVLSTGIPREIKKEFPDAFIVLLLREYTKDIYTSNPFVDQILLYDETKNRESGLIREIRSLKIDTALMLLPSKRINRVLFLSGVRRRIGTGHKFFQYITNCKNTLRNKYIPLRHEADYCMDLARKTGVGGKDITPEIYLSDEEKNLVSDIKTGLAGSAKFIVGIHTTSGNSAPNIPAAEYRRLIESLSADAEIQVVVTDNVPPAEIACIPDVKYPNADLSLRRSILNFAALDLLISASTGPMHIASALRVATLSVFCPMTACSPRLWGPLGNSSEIIQPLENYCMTKCPGDPKKCRFEGEGGIDAMTILAKIKKPSN